MPASLSKRYRNCTLYPSVVVLISTLIFSIIENQDYKSEWLSAEGNVMISLYVALACCAIMSALMLPMFLSNNKIIRKSRILTALCWFAGPLAWQWIFIGGAEEFKIVAVLYFLIFNLPFLAALIINYRQHLRNLEHFAIQQK